MNEKILNLIKKFNQIKKDSVKLIEKMQNNLNNYDYQLVLLDDFSDLNLEAYNIGNQIIEEYELNLDQKYTNDDSLQLDNDFINDIEIDETQNKAI